MKIRWNAIYCCMPPEDFWNVGTVTSVALAEGVENCKHDDAALDVLLTLAVCNALRPKDVLEWVREKVRGYVVSGGRADSGSETAWPI